MRVLMLGFYWLLKWYEVQLHTHFYVTLAVSLLIIFILLWIASYPRERRVQHYYR